MQNIIFREMKYIYLYFVNNFKHQKLRNAHPYIFLHQTRIGETTEQNCGFTHYSTAIIADIL